MTQNLLVVGPMAQWHRKHKKLPQIDGVEFVDFGGLTADVLDRAKPDFVLSALLGNGFDALDLARLLSELGYRGRYRALADYLPRPSVVLSEVQAVAPELDFDVVQISAED